MYFFSLWPPLWVIVRAANNRLFIHIEKIFFMWVGGRRVCMDPDPAWFLGLPTSPVPQAVAAAQSSIHRSVANKRPKQIPAPSFAPHASDLPTIQGRYLLAGQRPPHRD
jgi:hypothetical protein